MLVVVNVVAGTESPPCHFWYKQINGSPVELPFPILILSALK